MKTLKFKTNIKCASCLSEVAPLLDEEAQIETWNVNLQSADCILTVESNSLSAAQIRETLARAGFRGEAVEERVLSPSFFP